MTDSEPGGDQSHIEPILSLPRPWADDAQSIYEFLRAAIVRDERYRDFVAGLPDDPPEVPGRVTFAPGAIGHVLGQRAANPKAAVEPLIARLRELVAAPSAAAFAAFYEQLLSTNVLAVADYLVASFKDDHSDESKRVYAAGRLLALEAPQREPVKFGIVLLGVFGSLDDVELLTTLGVCGEFTPFVRVALNQLLPDVENALLEMASRSDGWAKADLVMQLCQTERADIKRWLLLEGFENTLVPFSTARNCAEAGGLAGLLDTPLEPDELDRVSQLMVSLVRAQGSPYGGIFELEGKHLAVRRYIEQALRAEPTIGIVIGLAVLGRSIKDGPAAPPTGGMQLAATCDEYFARDDIRSRLKTWRASSDQYVAWAAGHAISKAGV